MVNKLRGQYESKKSHKSYPQVFKDEAVLMVLEQGYSVADAAKSLGVSTSLLYNWKEKHQALQQGITLEESERDELKRLRRENKELRLKHDWIFNVAQPTREFMKQDVTAYMKYYNLERLHSANGDLSPVEFENSQLKVSSLA